MNNKKIIATAASVASVLAMAAGAGVAMAAPADTAGITIHGKQLNAQGRSFTAYKIGEFNNVIIHDNGTTDKSDDYADATITSVQTAKAAITAAAAKAGIRVDDAAGQDPIDAVVRAGAANDATMKTFAETLARPGTGGVTLPEAGKINGSPNHDGTEVTFPGMTEGYYLIVDSNGNSIVQATAIKKGDQTVSKFGSGSKQLALGVIDVKAGVIDVDKKSNGTDSDKTISIGDVVTYAITMHVPDKTQTKSWIVKDSLTGGTYVRTSDNVVDLKVQHGQNHEDYALAEKPTKQDGGFALDMSKVLTDPTVNTGDIITLTYKAKTTAASTDNQVTVTGTHNNGTNLIPSKDSIHVVSATMQFDKVNNLKRDAKLANAKFKIQKKGAGADKWLKWTPDASTPDEADGTWTEVAENAATEYTTAENGRLAIHGLGAGDYTIKETAAPDGYTLGDGVSFNVNVSEPDKSGNVTVRFTGDEATGSNAVSKTGEATGAGQVVNQPTLGTLAHTGVDLSHGIIFSAITAAIALGLGASVAGVAKARAGRLED